MSLSESKVIAACQSGDRAAQRELFEATNERVFRLATRLVGRQDAADVTQQVYLQVFRKIEQFSGQSTLATWIYRIAFNEALQHIRRSKTRRVASLEIEPVDDLANRESVADMRDALDAAMANIDPDLKAIFLLKEVEDLSYSEIAKVLNIPEGTVGSRLNRARRELQNQLKACGWINQ